MTNQVYIAVGLMAMAISAEAEDDRKEMVLLSLMHIMADRNKENASTHWIQNKVVLYVQPCVLTG